MKKKYLIIICLLTCVSLFAQNSNVFKIDKNDDLIMEMVYAFPHELKNDGITDGYKGDNIQGSSYELINPRQGDRSLDKYAVLKSAKADAFVVQTNWNIEVVRLNEKNSEIKVTIESALDNRNNQVAGTKVKSTGEFEKELRQFLESDYQVVQEVYETTADSTAIMTDYADYTSTADSEFSFEEPEKKTSANLKKIIPNGKTIPFPLNASYFTKKINSQPTIHEFETAVDGKYYSWNLDESIGLLYVKMKNGLEYYSFYTLDQSVITGLPFNLEMNYSSLEWCLHEFKGYLPQWTQVVEENDDTYLQVEFSTKDQFIHLEFFADSKNLKTVLIANKPLN